jgi:hypothetical protein
MPLATASHPTDYPSQSGFEKIYPIHSHSIPHFKRDNLAFGGPLPLVPLAESRGECGLGYDLHLVPLAESRGEFGLGYDLHMVPLAESRGEFGLGYDLPLVPLAESRGEFGLGYDLPLVPLADSLHAGLSIVSAFAHIPIENCTRPYRWVRQTYSPHRASRAFEYPMACPSDGPPPRRW